jgi:hypothetical protein
MKCHTEVDQSDLNYRMECSSCECNRRAKEDAKPNSLSVRELNAVIATAPHPHGQKFPCAKNWKRVDVAGVETYVGDTSYIVTLNNKISTDVEEINRNWISLEKTVTRYLECEGFIAEGTVVYVGLQRVSIKNPF